MLAATVKSLETIVYPVYGSPKVDGVRGIVLNGKLVSRNLKPIANKFVRKRFSTLLLNGGDGELILGSPTAKDVYRVTQSACNTITGEPDVQFYVFDHHLIREPFAARQRLLTDYWREVERELHVYVLQQQLLHDQKALRLYEEWALAAGYEGIMLRSPEGGYKHGRSTVREQGLMKLKRFEDGEAVILEVLEEMENLNAPTKDALGRTKRSSHQENKVGKGCAGALRVRDVKTGVEFEVGSGIDDATGVMLWGCRKLLVKDKALIKYKHFPLGVKDKPRFPVFLGLRERSDL